MRRQVLCYLLLFICVAFYGDARHSDKRWNGKSYHKNSRIQANWAQTYLDNSKFNGSENILDIGCGDGKLTAEIAKLVPKGNVVGIDKSPSMVSFANANYGDPYSPNLSFKIMDATQLPFQEEFDHIVSFTCMHWIKDQSKVLQSIAQSLKPNGNAYLIFPTKWEYQPHGKAMESITKKEKWKSYIADSKKQLFSHPVDDIHEKVLNAGLLPTKITLFYQDNVFKNKEEFAAWWTQVAPYIDAIPSKKREEYMNELLTEYYSLDTVDENGQVHWYGYLMEVYVEKTSS